MVLDESFYLSIKVVGFLIPCFIVRVRYLLCGERIGATCVGGGNGSNGA